MREGDRAEVRHVWTADELDHALTGLYMEIKPDQRGLAGVREKLMAAVDAQPQPLLSTVADSTGKNSTGESRPAESGPGESSTEESRPEESSTVETGTADTGTVRTGVVETGVGARRRRPVRRWLAAAAAVAVLTTGGVLAQTVLFSSSSATAQAQEALTSAADVAARAKDPVLADGQYRYVATHAWWMKGVGAQNQNFSFLNENLIETWIPADPSGEWLQRRSETGNRKWVKGTEAEARAAGVVIEESPWPEQRAKGGEFSGNLPEHGNWQFPRPEFVASLPTDPEQLYERLRADSGGGKHALVYAADALRTGLLPAPARANLLRALTYLPGLDVVDGAADLDGHRGVALGVSEGGERQEIILNPGTGELIGEREVSDTFFAGIPKGSLISYSAITTAVVDHIGDKPAS
ncbi:CU044_5270 family protein [Goodfellowiella coeruleoviolacea]|uniref:CU044_5270 family protein n=1 Tax=Goodfellowiella coeruleoviolacea TaxID=334858 RepID=A0AAE3GJ93_9PSEU|nr:CU044_5270 family protein [Goodfellowiella coeruleoviolacea]MCP2168374.1 hypothetical protein [Goodfellowiella coeruleoviolacea]